MTNKLYMKTEVSGIVISTFISRVDKVRAILLTLKSVSDIIY
jgi:hypothetical protein